LTAALREKPAHPLPARNAAFPQPGAIAIYGMAAAAKQSAGRAFIAVCVFLQNSLVRP